ncbi:HD-GYP domain-containing protein [Azohydromonas lata]|uniref:HD-GYP domain-containing protein n=1 Tax=Azohydromonas lata TaxID=45677 RepID=UPI0012F4C455|nr:hypothetical protein [Azohydromonas lata]
MRLISLSPEYLEAEDRLPFDVFDAEGKLLLAASEPMDGHTARATMRSRNGVYADAVAVADWRRRLAARVDELIRRDAPLSAIARARAEPARQTSSSAKPGEEWEALVYLLDAALRDPSPQQPWVQRVMDVLARARELASRRMDEALFHYIHNGTRHADHYSSHQALRCMLIAGEIGRELGFSEELLSQLDCAALTMNVAMRRLQDRLALMAAPKLDAGMRAVIDQHSVEAERLLREGGVTDPVWLEAVRLHHDDSLQRLAPQQLTPGQQLAALLRRVDIYCAKISRRAGRKALTAMQAAGQACMGPDGRPDRIGGALLKVVGLYPPGCFVKLASGETGIVLARGARADQPLVAVLLNARGAVLMGPLLRDSSQPKLGVRAALRADQVPVQPSLEQLHALRVAGRQPQAVATARAALTPKLGAAVAVAVPH